VSGRRRLVVSDQRGVSLIEVVLATVILTVVAVGLVTYFAQGRVWFDHEEHKRVATQLAQDSLERTIARGYEDIGAWRETRDVAGVEYTIEVDVTVNSPDQDMKTIESVVWWNQTTQAKRSVSLVTMVWEKGL
jgi:prepilin-type N-terminal cleavage/methylation domain-containing protein